MDLVVLILVIAVLAVVTTVGLLARPARRRLPGRQPAPGVDYAPGVGDDAELPRDTEKRTVATVDLPGADSAIGIEEPPGIVDESFPPGVEATPDLLLETPAPTAGRLVRLRTRLARSQSTLGRGLFALLSRDVLDEDTWEEVEDTLLQADVGVRSTQEIVGNLRTRVKVLGTRTPAELRHLLREELVRALGDYDRSMHTLPHADRPAVVLVVGVNGTGKTTTCGKLARVLVADGRTVVLGAADTFRAAAVAFDAVREGIERRVDTVVIDTAGRLHTKAGLMDELTKVKRVVEKYGAVDETLLVLDATTGQNGVTQARVFTEAVDVTGIVLTKLDGTAKGGIVIAVQREMGIPVKLVGLGEGSDDLAPFEPEAFADALLGDEAAL